MPVILSKQPFNSADIRTVTWVKHIQPTEPSNDKKHTKKQKSDNQSTFVSLYRWTLNTVYNYHRLVDIAGVKLEINLFVDCCFTIEMIILACCRHNSHWETATAAEFTFSETTKYLQHQRYCQLYSNIESISPHCVMSALYLSACHVFPCKQQLWRIRWRYVYCPVILTQRTRAGKSTRHVCASRVLWVVSHQSIDCDWFFADHACFRCWLDYFKRASQKLILVTTPLTTKDSDRVPAATCDFCLLCVCLHLYVD